MITVNIVCVGSLKETYWKDAVKEYAKRLQLFCKLNIIEVKENFLKANSSRAQVEDALKKEAEIINKYLKGYIVTLEVKGKKLTSENLSKKIEDLKTAGNSEITFVIGSSYGLHKNISDKSNFKLSFSDFTLPHQLMRVVLLEQVYRAFCISSGKTYHK